MANSENRPNPMPLLNYDQGDWCIQGMLTMQSLSSHWQLLEKNRPVHDSWKIDITQVTRMDSAGLAFLIDCARYAEQHQIQLSISGVHDQDWLKLMQVHRVKALLMPFINDNQKFD